MSTRISSLLAALCVLAACDASEPEPVNLVAAAEPDDRIECADPGSDGFAVACVVERSEDADGIVLTVRRADGGFHRLRVTSDGRGVIAADGAEPAKVAVIAPDRIEVAIAGARYRLPATIAERP